MKKPTKRLRLSTETVRMLAAAELVTAAGGLPPVLRTITCDHDECNSYACVTMVGCC